MSGPLSCVFCSSADSVETAAFAPVCALCASVSSLCDAGVAVFWHVSSKRYFSAGGVRRGLLRPGADAGRICRLGALPGCPPVTVDYHGVADAFEETRDLVAALGPEPRQTALLLSYVKPGGEVRLRAQAALEALAAATGLDAWLSFVKPPLAEPLRPGTKGHFMAVVGAKVLIDDHAEHSASAAARGLGALTVRSGDRSDIAAALSAARAGPVAWAAWRPHAEESARAGGGRGSDGGHARDAGKQPGRAAAKR